MNTTNNKHTKGLGKFQKIYQRRLLINCIINTYTVTFNSKDFTIDPKKIFYDTREYAFKKPTISRTDNAFMMAHGLNYDVLREYIQKKPVIDAVDLILNKLYAYLNTTFANLCDDFTDQMERIIAPRLGGRDVLSAFCLAGFPEFALMKSPSELENEKGSIYYDIYSLSRKLIGAWGTILISPDKSYQQTEALRKFVKCLNMYSNCFAMFMHHDKISKVQEGIQRWYQVEKEKELIQKNSLLSENDKNASIKGFEDTQISLINIILKSDKNFKKEQLEKYKILMNRIENNMEKGFWDVLKSELHNNKYDFFLKLLKEVRDEILLLFPGDKENKFRKDIDEKFGESFDMEFIKQMADHNAYSCSQFIALSSFLIETLKELQAPIRTLPMMEEWNRILDNPNGDPVEFENKGVNIIKFLLDEVQLVKDNIFSMQIMANFGINILEMT